MRGFPGIDRNGKQLGNLGVGPIMPGVGTING
jgi:hypothetical protein